jgi:hypothetical protein
MAPRIQQDVRESVPHLARRTKCVEVIAVREHATAHGEDSVHGPRESCGERFHSAGEIVRAGRLDERVQVVVLDRILNESEAPALARLGEAALELAHQSNGSQRRQSTPHLQGDVAGMTPRERRARTVIRARARAALAARTCSHSAPARCLTEIEFQLSSAACHRAHCDMLL